MDPVRSVASAIAVGAACGVVMASWSTPVVSAATPVIATITAPAEELIAWDIPVVQNEFVQRFVDILGRQQTDRMALYLNRSGRYEGMIRAKLREHGMPEDLVYLSMIESGFNPNARSQAAAVGLWQFIPETGRRYGLRIDAEVDERRDPEKSTDAAIAYLQDLHTQFGSWNLAAAAYNSGENRVARIMREVTGSEQGQESDFWRIRGRLPAETREYIPLMFAAALIGKEPQKFGLGGVERQLPVPVERVQVPGGTSLSSVAAAIGVDERAVRDLNPHLLKGRTPVGDTFPVRIPTERASLFAANFRPGTRASRSTDPATYEVRAGESLSLIARRHGLTVREIQRANGMGNRTTIQPGQTLRLPG